MQNEPLNPLEIPQKSTIKRKQRTIKNELKQYREAMHDLKNVLIRHELQKRADYFGIPEEEPLNEQSFVNTISDEPINTQDLHMEQTPASEERHQ